MTSLEAEVNTELIKLCDWLTANKLTLNIKKSNYVLFPSYNKRLLYNPKINIFDHDKGTYSPLDFKESVKYLGIFIDKFLNWKTHIDLITLKISKTIGIIARLRHFVPLSVTAKLYQSFILILILHYGISLWGQASQLNVQFQKISLEFLFQRVFEHPPTPPGISNFSFSPKSTASANLPRNTAMSKLHIESTMLDLNL